MDGIAKQPTFTFLPERRRYLNVDHITCVEFDRPGRNAEVTTLATDASESGYPSALTLFLDGEDVAILREYLAQYEASVATPTEAPR